MKSKIITIILGLILLSFTTQAQVRHKKTKKDYRIMMMKRINAYRAEIGRAPLKYTRHGQLDATLWAWKMSLGKRKSNFEHDYFTLNILNCSENIAYAQGHYDPMSCIDAWRNSSGHYRNLMDKKSNRCTIGYVKRKGVYYAVWRGYGDFSRNTIIAVMIL